MLGKLLLPILITYVIAIAALQNTVHAGGGRIEMDSKQGIANVKAAEITATIFTDNTLSQPATGETGTISFQNAESGQNCDTYQSTSDSNGQIKARCNSAQAGSFVVMLLLDSGEERTVAANFSNPEPSPQVVSGKYKLTASHESVKFTNAINTGFGVNVTLRDAENNEAIQDQTGVEYIWKVSNSEIVRLTETSSSCTNGVLPPCPDANGQFQGYKPGKTTVRITTKKAGQVLAETSISMTVSQADGAAYYYPPTPTPKTMVTPTPTPSPSDNPSPAASANTTTVTVIEPPTTSKSASPSQIEPSPYAQNAQSIPELASMETMDTSSNSKSWGIALLVVAGLASGLGAPIAWYLLETNPAAKKHLQQRITHVRKVLKVPLRWTKTKN